MAEGLGGASPPGGASEPELRGPRRRLLDTLRERGITDLSVLRAVDLTPRHLFVPQAIVHRAYEDAALPIGSGQTISQPSVHARYLSELRLTGHERALEIGTGSGYQTVLLSHLVEQVFSIERVRELLDRARDVIRRVDARNISLLLGDGTFGWREYAPYDAILVSAAAPDVPRPLFEQLAEGGRILIPLGGREDQMLTVATRRGDTLERRDITPVRFVPLVGAYGWSE
ncbi:MAG: protein-L-isoaspartate(D-aspartate) O-methyltransferase [Gemmatimonadales bacterium]